MFTADLVAAGAHVTAVGSRSAEAATAFAAEHGIPKAHDSYQALVDDADVDIVYVATPHPFHAPHAALALEAGKHALVEKPFTMNAGEACGLARLAEQRSLILLEAMWTRYLPHMIELDRVISDGTIGEIRTVIADHSQRLSTDPRHRINDPALGGGALLDLGIYPVWLADYLLGAPTEVHASSARTATGVDRQCAMVLDHANGAQAVLQCALDTPGPNTAAILGTRGWIGIDPVWHDASSFTVYDTEENVLRRFDEPVPGRGMHYQALAAERLIVGDASPDKVMLPATSVRIMETMDRIRRTIGLVYPGEEPE
jgi:predicted dehydrogenase